MKLYVDKIIKHKEFNLSNEVTIACSLDELKNLKLFIDNTYNYMSKIDAKNIHPHSHFKDYLRNEQSNSSDIIIALDEIQKG